jgi:hypothetical protein
MRTFERMGVIGPAPNDPSPVGIDANELDPTKMPYSPDMIQLMPSKIRRAVVVVVVVVVAVVAVVVAVAFAAAVAVVVADISCFCCFRTKQNTEKKALCNRLLKTLKN